MSRAESWLCRSAPWRSFAERVLPWASQGAAFGGDVLEIGAGSGAMAAAALDRWPSAHLVATDLDPAMVAAARERLAPYGARADARVADATALAFGDASFDGVLSFLMLHHTVRWEAVLAEAARVLRPGGRLVGYDLLDTRTARAIHVLDRSPYRLLTGRELKTALERSGLTEVTLRRGLGGQVVRFAARRP
jgi:SAM-dependent methyltransferase